MYYVYILQSLQDSSRIYIGYSDNIGARLEVHNSGGSPYTAKYKPWILKTYCSFSTKSIALQFEKYLKSHSGKAFLRKRLI